MTPSSSAGSAASVWSSAAGAAGWGTARVATLQQLSGFGMRNLALQGTGAGALLNVYFKLGTRMYVAVGGGAIG
jgi:hypothetical protein